MWKCWTCFGSEVTVLLFLSVFLTLRLEKCSCSFEEFVSETLWKDLQYRELLLQFRSGAGGLRSFACSVSNSAYYFHISAFFRAF